MLSINEVLAHIKDGFKKNHNKIISFSGTDYSYEEWLNWEIFDILNKAGIRCTPKPSYKRYGEAINDRYQADIYGHDNERDFQFIMEVALVGDATQSKWIKKIERDREKLTGFTPENKRTKKYQLVILSANYQNLLSEWDYWLSKLNFWSNSKPATQVHSTKIGEVVICGWEV